MDIEGIRPSSTPPPGGGSLVHSQVLDGLQSASDCYNKILEDYRKDDAAALEKGYADLKSILGKVLSLIPQDSNYQPNSFLSENCDALKGVMNNGYESNPITSTSNLSFYINLIADLIQKGPNLPESTYNSIAMVHHMRMMADQMKHGNFPDGNSRFPPVAEYMLNNFANSAYLQGYSGLDNVISGLNAISQGTSIDWNPVSSALNTLHGDIMSSFGEKVL